MLLCICESKDSHNKLKLNTLYKLVILTVNVKDIMAPCSLSQTHFEMFCAGPGEEAESDVFCIHHCTAHW